ncbi:MAG: phosphatase PAP2 family protein, partial [Firmicutes bacterium]|nr:phosphatase PAP2 family protein [Bacillota bacterium]
MPLLDKAMVMLSHLGDGALLWIILAVVLFLMAGTRRIGRDMIVAMIVALIIGNLIVKNVIGRVRPYDVYTMLQPLVDRPSDWSFPSGHTMHSFAAATVLFLHERKAGIAALLLAAG